MKGSSEGLAIISVHSFLTE